MMESVLPLLRRLPVILNLTGMVPDVRLSPSVGTRVGSKEAVSLPDRWLSVGEQTDEGFMGGRQSTGMDSARWFLCPRIPGSHCF